MSVETRKVEDPLDITRVRISATAILDDRNGVKVQSFGRTRFGAIAAAEAAS